MQISSNQSAIKNLFMKKLSHDDVKKIKQEIVDNANKYTFTNFAKNDFSVNKKLSSGELILKNNMEFQKFLYSKGIDGISATRVSDLQFNKPSFLDTKV